MKKIIYATGILAAVALSFSACQKEQEINEEPQSGKLVTVSFTAEKAGTETRTGIANEGTTVSYEWTEEDANNIKLFTVSNTDSGETLTQVSDPDVTVTATKLTISAQVEANATYTFRAVIAGTWTNDGKKPRIDVEQSPSSTGYDPNADVLVSNDVDVTVGESETTTGELPMAFERKVVINKMTLLNMTAGEKVSKVVISSDKNLAGTLTGDKDAITVNYSDAEVPSSGEFPVYFVTIPNEGQTLTVEVTTDQKVYSKTFASTINFILGQFTKFKVNLPAGVANTALSLPLEDPMTWAITGGDDETSELQVSALTAMQGTKKIYDSATKAFKGGTGLKLGTSSVNGSITTNPIDLSSNFYVTIDAKTYGTDNSQLTVSVDNNVIKSVDLTGDYQTYNINCPAATNASKVTIGVAGKRGYVKNLQIRSGGVPEISVTSNNPIEVGNSASSQEITYSIINPSSGVSLTASTEANWITNLSVATSVTFDVAAQEQGDPYREAIITLSYEGAPSVNVTVQQAAGETSPYAAIHTSNVTLTTTGGTSASTAKVNDFDAIKAGTSSTAGAVKITVPANKENLHIHAAGWKGENVTLSISGATTSPSSLNLIKDDGITSNSPFTLSGDADDYYFKITIPKSSSETELTFTATSGKRFVIWGVNIEDPRQDAGMSWSSETASATITDSGVDFTAPTLTLGNAYDVTYYSTNISVATIDSDGEVSVLAEGTTTIQAVFAGDDDYKPATVEYTLSVTDNSSTSPTLKYTLDGTDSSQGSNGYATESEITQSSIGWIAVANTTIKPWRFGGKNLTNVDRVVYSKSAISSNISSIEVVSGEATATVNSLTITVHNTAADAASGNNAIATKTVSSDIASSTVTLTKSDATSWAGKFYRIVYNVTAGSSNQYVQFVSAKFYGTN